MRHFSLFDSFFALCGAAQADFRMVQNSLNILNMLDKVKSAFPECDIIAGNIATAEAADQMEVAAQIAA